MTSSRFSQAVDSWSIQAVVASRYLLRLYRALGDGNQASTAAQAGISVFHAMVDGQSKKPRGLRGARSSTAKAFRRSLQGYRVAFPEQIANAGIFEALQAASEKCTRACLEGLGGEESPEERSEATAVIHKNILEALLGAADLKTANEPGHGSEERNGLPC